MPQYVAPGVFIEESRSAGDPIASVPTSVGAFVGGFMSGPLGKAEVVESPGRFEERFGPVRRRSPASLQVAQFFRNGGRTALIIRCRTAKPGRQPSARELISRVRGLASERFNLLCVPETATLGTRDASAVIGEATRLCELRRAIYLIDAPSACDAVPNAIAWIASIRPSANSAVYLPRVRTPDPEDGSRMLEIGPSGSVAGLIARIDETRGVWKAPAGLDAVLEGVSGVPVQFGDTQIGDLTRAGMNALRAGAGVGPGIVVWGARTTAGRDGASGEWKYVPVRRLAMMIEESVESAVTWAVFEPGGVPTWSRLVAQVEGYLIQLWRQGALIGATPREAFFVRCDASTTTQDDIRSGRAVLMIGIAALRPAEFIVLRLVVRTAETPV